MGEARPLNIGDTAEFVRQMSVGASHEVIERRIPFANNDVPAYLEKLRQFEKESREVEIEVR